MGPTDSDVDTTCKHTMLLPRRATDMYDKCAICGKFVRDSLDYVGTTTIGTMTNVSMGRVAINQPAIQIIHDRNKIAKKLEWTPPPNAPKKRNLYNK